MDLITIPSLYSMITTNKGKIAIELIKIGHTIEFYDDKTIYGYPHGNNALSDALRDIDDLSLIKILLQKSVFLRDTTSQVYNSRNTPSIRVAKFSLLYHEALLRNATVLLNEIDNYIPDLTCNATTMQEYLKNRSLTQEQVDRAHMSISRRVAKYRMTPSDGEALKKVITIQQNSNENEVRSSITKGP